MAALVSATAQPLVSTRNACPVSTSSNVSRAPNGACASRCARIAAKASSASWPGATRALTRTRTPGASVFDAFATSGASMPVTVIAGCAQMRDRMVPLPIGETPSSRPASARSCASSYSGVSRSALRSPSTATEPSAAHSVSRSRMAASIASGTAPPYMPECDACARVSMRRLKATAPRSATVMRRRLEVPVAGIGDDDRIRGEQVAVLAEEVRERARRPLLLALDEHGDAEVEVAGCLGERADGADVRHHAGLVVGGAATVQAVAALRRLERRRLPVLVLAGGLHVVVRVEEHGRPPVAGRAAGHHRGLAELGPVLDGRAPHLDELEHAGAAQELGDRLGALRRRGPDRTPARTRTGCARGSRGRRRWRGSPRRPPTGWPRS